MAIGILLIGGAVLGITASAEETIDTPTGSRTIDCGRPAIVGLFEGSDVDAGDASREARLRCDVAEEEQVLGGATFLLFGVALLIGPAISRRLRARREAEAEPPLVAAEIVEPGDPGWPVGRMARMAALPFHGSMPQEVDGLAQFRLLFFAFSNALVLFGFVLLFLPDESPSTAVAWAVAAVVAGLVGALARRITERPLDCTDDGTLVATYRTRFFLRLAWGELPALVAFVGALVSARWVYLVGLAFAAYAFARLAPTAGGLARDQEELIAQGCGRDLVAVLRSVRSAKGG